ncbi:MAG: exodeoxyribonuclease VII small subunit [Cyanobacteria bacterium P01_A01_bin.123]
MNLDWSYETAIAEVETIISRLEAGELPLAKIFEQFQTAVEALAQCETFLQEKQAQVDLLVQTLAPLD